MYTGTSNSSVVWPVADSSLSTITPASKNAGTLQLALIDPTECAKQLVTYLKDSVDHYTDASMVNMQQLLAMRSLEDSAGSLCVHEDRVYQKISYCNCNTKDLYSFYKNMENLMTEISMLLATLSWQSLSCNLLGQGLFPDESIKTSALSEIDILKKKKQDLEAINKEFMCVCKKVADAYKRFFASGNSINLCLQEYNCEIAKLKKNVVVWLKGETKTEVEELVESSQRLKTQLLSIGECLVNFNGAIIKENRLLNEARKQAQSELDFWSMLHTPNDN